MDSFVFADIEASSLINGYPIEIGWAWREGDKVECASILIAPPEKWRSEYMWDPIAEAVHGLSREDVCTLGDAPQHACYTLNTAFDGKDLVFDTGGNGTDVAWMKMLYGETALIPTFGILSVTSEELVRSRAAFMGIPDDVYASMQTIAPPMLHRAAVDAIHWTWWMIAIDKIAILGLEQDRLNPVAVDELRKRCAEIQLPAPTRS